MNIEISLCNTKDLRMLFFTVLISVVALLLAYSMMSDKGKNTVHARKPEDTQHFAKQTVKHVAVQDTRKAA